MRLTPGKLMILAQWLLTRRPTSVAVDITHKCNLKCLHCYWWRQEHSPELGDAEMIAFLKKLRARGLRAAILYGGEPTLRPEICRAAARIFDATLAFTNGVNGFPELLNGQWILSLDGPEAENDRIRGEGVYQRAVANLKTASRPPIVHMTISKVNQDSLWQFAGEMMRLPIKGIGFSFVTPNRGMKDEDLFIPLTQRNRVVMELLELRKKYGEKIGFTPAMAEQLLTHGAFNQWNSLSTCPVGRRVRCFRSDGRKKTCTYGNQADCSRCGCAAVVAYR
ncbi:MAG: radical SAM protein, partial [Deltaproteobacteria bacterium]|nr:radical SAM protein [Deltaproteobacteria bacterium]